MQEEKGSETPHHFSGARDMNFDSRKRRAVSKNGIVREGSRVGSGAVKAEGK